MFIFVIGVEEEDEEDFCSCVSMFCPPCMEQQNNALREVEALMTRLQAAEALFPSSKVLLQSVAVALGDTPAVSLDLPLS